VVGVVAVAAVAVVQEEEEAVLCVILTPSVTARRDNPNPSLKASPVLVQAAEAGPVQAGIYSYKL
jgi:hypothetical protein